MQPLKSGGYEINSYDVNADKSFSWQHLFALRHSNPNNNFQLQLSSSYMENDRLFFRKINNSVNPSWYELATRATNTFTGNQVINGNIGIETANPQNKLQIGEYRTNNVSKLSIPGVYNFEEVKLGQYGNGRTGLEMITHAGQTQSFGVRLYSGTDTGVNGLLIETADPSNSAEELNYTAKMVVNINGNVGVGTLNPDSKLAVNGTIHSKEVKVDMSGWSDFVFKKEYNLPTLEQVEKHIAEKGHLENIPSEEEVLKNGINLGEMNAKLLQKIEEMTLYIIELKKDISVLKQENGKLADLEKRFLTLEKTIKK
ncbi:hypothetical protein [Flavobacterium anhuiense]|uniref:hypothetical protein n=1 Tax=Flavobacterium anhuiense TaxID=459526 RepID=UPI0034D98122